jgi:predicted acylesterase/phospholipase RssA
MKKIGLALSGGGFRASLYHLGMVRFLRDAGILSQVTHITSVSGGSILAAHLVLNWDRYNGSPKEFDAVASEFLAFVRLDVRNRITRRFPLTLPLRGVRRLVGRSNRKLTRTGLLEYHYEKHLYGDTSLFELPQTPQLHVLATNLSEGCLCSFTRDGLLMVRRGPAGALRLDRIPVGLATVAMAVTASSAFPGFFPPLELTGADVGEGAGEFGRQAYTDGGVFDNLGVRMFRCLERPLLAECPLSRDDFLDFPAALEALRAAGARGEESPLRRVTQVMMAACRRQELLFLPGPGASGNALPSSPADWNGDDEDLVLSGLWNVLRRYQFQLDPLFVGLTPEEPDAEMQLRDCRAGGKPLDVSDQLWLNLHLLEAAFRQATGRACVRRLNSGLDGVLVSDVGKRIEVQGNRGAGGLIRTAIRASDILMDRVWQLEKDTFHDTPGFVFAPITEVVEPSEDPTAPHPEIQRQAANIRTDLDRFSPLEISSLARHGYCVARKSCRARPDLFGADLPRDAPWDPSPAPPAPRPQGPPGGPAAVTAEARALQGSALRRIWSTLLDYRDWVSYIYVPLIVPILIGLPYVVAKSYQRSVRVSRLIDSLSQGSRDLEKMSDLLENSPTPWEGVAPEEVPQLGEPNLKGFQVLQDSRIIDLRRWKPAKSGAGDPGSFVYGYRRLKVLKEPDNLRNNDFRVQLLAVSPKTAVRFPRQQLRPKLLTSNGDGPTSAPQGYRWEASFDFQQVPPGDYVDLIVEYHTPGQVFQWGEGGTVVPFDILADTAELTTWVLMPEGKDYQSFHIIRHETGNPEKVEAVKVVTEYLAEDSSLIAFKLLSLKAGTTYEINWSYK